MRNGTQSAAQGERTHLFFGSALADHLVDFRLLRPVTTSDSTSLAEGVSFLVSLGLLLAISLGGRRVGGGGGKLGACWFPPPRNCQQTWLFENASSVGFQVFGC